MLARLMGLVAKLLTVEHVLRAAFAKASRELYQPEPPVVPTRFQPSSIVTLQWRQADGAPMYDPVLARVVSAHLLSAGWVVLAVSNGSLYVGEVEPKGPAYRIEPGVAK